MGQMRDKRIVQSRIWLDPNADTSIPPYDYDLSYPVSVYAAIQKSFDEPNVTLADELQGIYRLINDKQVKIQAGVAGRIMTWSGIAGKIGELQVTKSISSDTLLQSHQKIPTERAVAAELEKKLSTTQFSQHVNNHTVHITEEERTVWNAKASQDDLNGHLNNTTIHVTEEERTRWNRSASSDSLEIHITDYKNPHRVTAHQVGAYTRREIDDLFKSIRASYFVAVNIAYDSRTNLASLVAYQEDNWNPNYVLRYGEELPSVTDESLTYFALIPATDYSTNETNECFIYIKVPGLNWQQVGIQTMSPGDLVIRFPDTEMFVWMQGRFRTILTSNANESGVIEGGGDGEEGGDGSVIYSSLWMWRPVVTPEGVLTWHRSEENNAPDPISIIGPPGKTPQKGVDYDDGADGIGVPVGGSKWDVLIKSTDADYETSWCALDELIRNAIKDGIPAGLVTWDSLEGRPTIYQKMGDSEKDLMSQAAISKLIRALQEGISGDSDSIIGKLNAIQETIRNHLKDTNNPHSITATAIGAASAANLSAHTSNTNNPHRVTKAQVGLGNVDNTSDLDKPISNATKKVLNELNAKLSAILGDGDTTNMIVGVEWEDSTCTFRFTFLDQSTLDAEIPIIPIFQALTYDRDNKELVFPLPDGTEKRIDISELIQSYTGNVGSQIKVTVEGTQISATLIPDSIDGTYLKSSLNLRGNPTTTTQPAEDRSTRIATTEFTKQIVIDNLISYETDRPVSANMARILNEQKADVDDILDLLENMEGMEVIDNLTSTNPFAALSANMGRYLDVTKAPRVHTSPSGSTFGRASIDYFGHARASTITPLMNGTAWVGTDDGYYARADHRHPVDVSRAPIHWPDTAHNQFKMTGEPRAETPPNDSMDDRIATTEWVRKNSSSALMGSCRTRGTGYVKKVILESSVAEPPVYFQREIGSTVTVKFEYEDVSDENFPTALDVQNTGPAEILYGGYYMKKGWIGKDHAHTFVYDGRYWWLINPVAGTGTNGDRRPDDPLWNDDNDWVFTITFDPDGGTIVDKIGHDIQFDPQGGTITSGWDEGYDIRFDAQGGIIPNPYVIGLDPQGGDLTEADSAMMKLNEVNDT